MSLLSGIIQVSFYFHVHFLGGTSRTTRAEQELPELTEALEATQEEFAGLKRARSQYLEDIAKGTMETLAMFDDCVAQSKPIDLMPSEELLAFKPQRNEICFVQIEDVPLGRMRSRTRTVKTGGGYRLGKLYVTPLKKGLRRVVKTPKSVTL